MKRTLAGPFPLTMAAATVLVAALTGCSTGSTSDTGTGRRADGDDHGRRRRLPRHHRARAR